MGVQIPPGLPKFESKAKKKFEKTDCGWTMKDAVQFLSQVRVELTRVVWPKFDDWVGSTIVVLVLVALFSVYLWGVDWVFSQLMLRVLDYTR